MKIKAYLRFFQGQETNSYVRHEGVVDETPRFPPSLSHNPLALVMIDIYYGMSMGRVTKRNRVAFSHWSIRLLW